jgi:hypothetical protein
MTLLELATALSVFARGGESCEPRVLLTEPRAQGWRIVAPERATDLEVARGVVDESGWTCGWAVGWTQGYTVAAFVSGPDAPLAGGIDAEPLLGAAVDAVEGALP